LGRIESLHKKSCPSNCADSCEPKTNISSRRDMPGSRHRKKQQIPSTDEENIRQEPLNDCHVETIATASMTATKLLGPRQQKCQ
jgi:hypothetical protein